MQICYTIKKCTLTKDQYIYNVKVSQGFFFKLVFLLLVYFFNFFHKKFNQFLYKIFNLNFDYGKRGKKYDIVQQLQTLIPLSMGIMIKNIKYIIEYL